MGDNFPLRMMKNTYEIKITSCDYLLMAITARPPFEVLDVIAFAPGPMDKCLGEINTQCFGEVA